MEDVEIINLYWERSESAIAETAKKYGSYCRSIAYNILSNGEDADECVNDAYMGAWNAIPPQRPSRLAVFVGKITRNIALSRFDYKTAKKRDCELQVILSELGDCIRSREDVESYCDEKELGRAISDFLKKCGVEARTVFLRRYWYADSVADVAARFQMSESKVKSMLFRTRKQLRDHLGKEGITL